MTPITFIRHKNTAFNLSEQVKRILHEKGFSFLFNYSDYFYFKSITKKEFNKPQAIANLFIQENQTEVSDFNSYVF